MQRIVIFYILLLVSIAEAREPASYDDLMEFARELAATDERAELEIIGQSAQGRDIPLMTLSHGAANPWKVLLLGSQHGDEVAGYEACLELLRHYQENPQDFPEDTELSVILAANPDGIADYERRNGAGFDLNRDHVILSQPETRAIHAAARRIEPHVSVDCHEYTRDSGRYSDLGWVRWPLIMMDAANSPLLPSEARELGVRWVESASEDMARAGFSYTRYYVGGPPNVEELRYSTLDTDDARNGLGILGGLGFIIESGVYRGHEDPQADLDERVAAYQVLLRRFVENRAYRDQTRRVVEQTRAAMLPPFIPVNFFWANDGLLITDYPVKDAESGETVIVPTADFMKTVAVKKTVVTPAAYAIVSNQEQYAQLLDAHDIKYAALNEPRSANVEKYRLTRIENNYDEVYARYSGRQIVERELFPGEEIPAGALLVPLDQPLPLRIPGILEPNMLFGLYQWEKWQETLGESDQVPVWRVMK